ncbi:MAG TPA: tetratricopeptide repeat protein [Sphingomonas sp.]|jgi:hypothetical protein
MTRLLIILIWMAAVPAAAAQSESVSAAHQQSGVERSPRGYPAKDVKHFEATLRRADKGSADAQAEVARLHYGGFGVPVDYALAAKWFAKAAEQGHPIAQRNLRIMAVTNRMSAADFDASLAKWPNSVVSAPRGGVDPDVDDRKAVRLAERDAAKGSVEDQLSLGESYYLGRGTQQDFTLAARWFTAAAAQGRPEAQYNLGIMSAAGRGVPQDPAAAMRWYMKAADQGYLPAQQKLGLMFLGGEGVPASAPEAARWLHIASAKGSAWAQAQLGALYAAGTGVPASNAEAYFWLDLAVDRLPATPVDPASKRPSGVDREQAIILRGAAAAKLSPQQLAEARQLSSEWKEASKRNGTIQLVLADRYLSGRGVRQSNVEAYRWLSRAILDDAKPWETPLPGAISSADRDVAIERRAALRARMTGDEINHAEQLTIVGLPIR